MLTTRSFFVNEGTTIVLYWQDGYGCLSIDKSNLLKIIAYVLKQKEYHALNQNIKTDLEIIDSLAPLWWGLILSWPCGFGPRLLGFSIA